MEVLWESCENAVGSDLKQKNANGKLFNNTCNKQAFFEQKLDPLFTGYNVIGSLCGLFGNVHCSISLLIQGSSMVDYQALAQKISVMLDCVL